MFYLVKNIISLNCLNKLVCCNCRRHYVAKVSSKPSTIGICGQEYQTDEWTNVTAKIVSLTGRQLTGRQALNSNPLALITDGIKEQFSEFDHFEFPSPVVDLEANFDSLLIGKDHVSRSKSDTYYVNCGQLLRSHTSAHQSHCIKKGSNGFVCIADVFRRDTIDRTHFPVFHQCEILKLYSKNEVLSGTVDILRDPTGNVRTETTQEHHTEPAARQMELILKESIEAYIRRLLGQTVAMRWVSAYFPFTHPSFELEVNFNGEWLEILGCGVVEHKLLESTGVEDKVAWALGFGLERLAMLKYNITDIRTFWSLDSGFLSQFKSVGPWDNIRYRPVSVYPQCSNDLSFWLPVTAASGQEYSPNDFYDLVRSVGGDLVEQVNLIDDFTNKKGRRSNCYRITYRGMDRTLTQKEVNEVHVAIAETAKDELGIEIR